MKAVIYARYSSDNQREESIEGQIRECTAFAEKNGITILRHYIDRAFSAKTDNRPEFQNMIKDSSKRLFDMIIVWKLDMFARNRYDSARYKAALKKNGVKVVSATEVISDGAEGIILESVLEGYAEYYSADLSEKVVRGMTENALKSKYNGGTLPIGYQIDSDQCFQLDPLTAPFVREAFQRYDEGATMTRIRDWLNEQGVKNTRGQKMTYNSIQHLLNNRRYIGEYTYRDIVVPDGIPAIVPQDLFDRVQEKLAKNKKAPARHKAEDDYLLTTKLFCGYCGAYLCGESGTSHTGNVHHYYKCVSVKKKRTECHKKSVRKEWIEDLVVRETMRMVMDDKAIEAIVSMLMDLQDRENVNLPLYEQQLRETDTAIQNLLNAIQQGILTKSTKGRLEELETTKEELETKIACEKLAKPKVSAEFMTFWLHRFRKLDVRQKSHRKMLLDTFINAIFLYDDKMVITFNYKDGTDTITFDDLKTALADQKTGSDLDCSTAPKEKGTERCLFLLVPRHLAMPNAARCGGDFRFAPCVAGTFGSPTHVPPFFMIPYSLQSKLTAPTTGRGLEPNCAPGFFFAPNLCPRPSRSEPSRIKEGTREGAFFWLVYHRLPQDIPSRIRAAERHTATLLYSLSQPCLFFHPERTAKQKYILFFGHLTHNSTRYNIGLNLIMEGKEYGKTGSA